MQRTQFGPYRVVRLLGQGGMGTVYEALDPASGRTVAVKTLPLHLADDAAVRRRFRAEIDTLMTLQHPGIARMIGFGEQDGVPFFAMEFVPGLSLEQLLRSGRRFTWRETVAIALEIVRVLKSAHDQGVVHRDLKPANLMFPPAAGGGFHVKLTDFGIAKLFGETGHTRQGMAIGTPEYMPPEQASGQTVDARADLYSLGMVMFAMLAGRPPFQGSVEEVVEWQRSRQPPRVSTVVANAPPALDDLIARLLAKPPASRPANATVVARQLTDLAALPPDAAPEMPPTLPMHPPTARLAETIAADSADPGRVPQRPADRPAGGPSSFTTVEAARAKQAGAGGQASMLTACAALTTIAGVIITGWWSLLRPWPWPDPDAERRRYEGIVAMLSDPHDLGDPCREIAAFLARHPRGPFSAAVHDLGREVALDRLHRLSRHRFPTYVPKSSLERAYLEAIRGVDSDPQAAVTKLRGLLTDAGDRAADRTAAATEDPCAAVERPDAATWQELARRQLEIVTEVVRREDALRRQETLTDKGRAAAILAQAAAYRRETETVADATRRVVALTRRHQMLTELVETYAAKPHCDAEVAEARRLLDADR